VSTQSEAQLENNLIAQLQAAEFEKVTIENADALKANLKRQLELANDLSLTEREFDSVLISLEKGNLFDKSKRLKGKIDVVHDDGTISYLSLLFNDPTKNLFQVTKKNKYKKIKKK